MVEYQRIEPDAPQYPRALFKSHRSPPTLYAIGNVDLLSRCGVGICGSRDATGAALEHAYEFGVSCAQSGFIVVSGYARGVDREAHRGALRGGGATIAVLPEGINYFTLTRELQGLAKLDDNFLALSMFEPDAPWTVWNATKRNELIVGLSEGLFVIEAREKGGTLRAGQECMKQRKALWVIDYEKKTRQRKGNEMLLSLSATAIKTRQDLRAILENVKERSTTHEDQMVLPAGGFQRAG